MFLGEGLTQQLPYPGSSGEGCRECTGQLELTRVLRKNRAATHICIHCWARNCPGILKGTGKGQ